MVRFVKVACVSLGLVIAASGNAAFARQDEGTSLRSKFTAPAPNQPAADLYGKSLPPIGYVDFCARGENECQFSGGKNQRLKVTTAQWNLITSVNATVNATIEPVSAPQQYHLLQYWNYPVSGGDCNSYTLLKKRYLQELGIAPEMLLLTVVLTETDEGHLVLTIPTENGDYILDNRRSEILRWDETGYIFLKRQSQETAKEWVSLQKASPAVAVTTRSRSLFSTLLNFGARAKP